MIDLGVQEIRKFYCSLEKRLIGKNSAVKRKVKYFGHDNTDMP